MAKVENQIENGKDEQSSSFLHTLVLAVMPFLAVFLVIVIWFIGAGVNNVVIPTPLQVIQRMIKLCVTPVAKTSLLGHILASLVRVFKALFFAIVIGVPLGVCMGWSRAFRSTIGVLFELIRPIPALAWIPLLVAWFGISETSKVIMVFLGALMPIVVNSYTAIALVPSLYIDVGKMFNAVTDWQILKNVVLPASLPTIFAGIRNGTSVAWMVVLAAEMLAAKSGLGFLINRGMESFDVALIMCGMVLIGIIGALLALLTNFIERKVCPWNRSIVSE